MADKTLTRMDLADAVHSQVGLSRNDSADLVESVLTHMSDALVSGERSRFRRSAHFRSAKRRPASAATPKQAKRCRSTRAVF